MKSDLYFDPVAMNRGKFLPAHVHKTAGLKGCMEEKSVGDHFKVAT